MASKLLLLSRGGCTAPATGSFSQALQDHYFGGQKIKGVIGSWGLKFLLDQAN